MSNRGFGKYKRLNKRYGKELNRRQSYRLYIPSHIDIDKLIKDNPPTMIRSFKKDYLLYIMSLLISIPARNPDLVIEFGYVPIHAKYVQKFIHNYKEYLTYLIDNHIIESNESYIVGSRSKEYRFCCYTQNISNKEVLISDKTLIAGICNNNEGDSWGILKYKNLFDHFNDRLNIKYNAALEYLNRCFPENNKSLSRKRDKSIFSLNTINDHSYYFSFDTFSRRLSTVLTNMPKGLRQFINYDGMELAEVDISSCQPYLSLALLDKSFYDKYKICIKGSNGSYYQRNIFTYDYFFNHRPHIDRIRDPKYMSNKDIKTINKIIADNPINHNDVGAEDNDLSRYIYIVKKGMIYDYMTLIREIAEQETNGLEWYDHKDYDYSNNNGKSFYYYLLFSHNCYIGQEDIPALVKRQFKKYFPNVYKIIKLYKKNNYKCAAKILQSIESFLIIDIISDRISRENKNLPIYTIHDSIVTLKGYVNYVAEVMKEELIKYIKYEPILKIKYWNQDYLLE